MNEDRVINKALHSSETFVDGVTAGMNSMYTATVIVLRDRGFSESKINNIMKDIYAIFSSEIKLVRVVATRPDGSIDPDKIKYRIME
jgi:hypothetical protein